MNKKNINYLLIVISSLPFAPVIASTDSNEWQFELTPYLWAAGIDGTMVADGTSSPIDNDYNFFLLENLDAVASATFVAKKQRLSFLFDGFYAKYSDNVDRRFTHTDLEMKLGFVEGAIGYQLFDDKDISLIVGVRNIYTDTSIDISPGPSVSVDKSWLDPLIGLQASFPITQDWSFSLRGDIGGGHDTEYVFNSMLNVNYQMTEHMALKMSYRYMRAELEQNRLLQDISLSGFGMGLGIQF